MNRLSANSSHPLIPRDPTYSVNRKLVTFHSVDRNVVQWPHANEFEIQLPEALTSVESMRLAEIALPSSYYNVSRELQNTTFQLTVPSASPSTFVVTLEDGFYSSAQIANAITHRVQPIVATFAVHYNEVSQKLWFSCADEFSIDAAADVVEQGCAGQVVPEAYCPPDCDYIQDGAQFAHYSDWGLPYNLGLLRRTHGATQNGADAIRLDYEDTPTVVVQPNYYYVEATFPTSLSSQDVIYMEVDKYNSMDELRPYPQRTNNLLDSDYNGRVNAAFAKIPISRLSRGQTIESKNGSLQNASNHFNPPLERVQKLRFRFRYHDGRLVDFKQENFNFSIAFNELRNEPLKNMIVRVPDTYLMT